MTVEETKKAFAELKAQGQTDEDILATLYVMFADDKISLDELEKLVNVLGYELTEEFKSMSPEDQKVKGYREVDEKAEDVTDKEVEEAKEVKKEEVVDDEDEETKARKLFGFDK